MTFTGFNVKYPEYEVITPQTNKSYTFRSLNVSEEENLKGSLMTPNKVADHLNVCLFQTMVKRPEGITTLNDFLKNTTLKDRDALLYGLYHISYEEIRNYKLTCGKCSKEFEVTVQASSTFNYKPYPGKDILSDRVTFELPITKGVFVTLKQPTLLDEIMAIKSLSTRPGSTLEIITETLIIEKFEEDIPDSKEPKIYDDRIDVVDAYFSLPARDKRKIFEQYTDRFGKYGIELKMQSNCPDCGRESVHNLDLVESFFRSLYSA